MSTIDPTRPGSSRRGFSGMTGFTVVALGQFFSLLGTSMTSVALTIWAWQVTGTATALALVGFLAFAPMVVFSPVAGALVDRWNRRLVMMLVDMGAGLASIALLTLYLLGLLQMWHLYVAVFFAGIFQAFQFPAYSAAARTGNNALTLGSAQSAGAAGAVAGGLLIAAWGGPKRKIKGVLIGWAAALFAGALFSSVVNPCNQAIWQRKTPPDIQGRAFSVRLLIAQIAGPLGQLLAGPLADRVVEPAMKPGGALAHALGGIFGTGAGSGMALLLVITGITGTIASLVPFGIRAVRDVETIVPDHDALPAAAAGLP